MLRHEGLLWTRLVQVSPQALSLRLHTAPAIPTSFWDRRLQTTPGRLRRALARPFSAKLPAPGPNLRKKGGLSALPAPFQVWVLVL